MELDVDRLRCEMETRGITQTQLASDAGISRATLSALLNGRTARVRPRTERRLAAALGLPSGSLGLYGLDTIYRRLVADRHQYLDFTGLGIVTTGSPIPIDRGFAPLTILPWRNGDRCPGDPASHVRGRTPTKRPPDPVPLGDELRHSRHLVLLGGPGDGKTTVLRHIARAYATGRQAECGYPSEQFLPIMVYLADWAKQLEVDPEVDLAGAAWAQLGDPNMPHMVEWLRTQIATPGVLLLLDGLDEVWNPDIRATLIEKVRLTVKACPEAHVVVTSRIVGFEMPNLAEPFDVRVVQPLTTDAIKGFAHEWCALRHGHPADRNCPQCLKRMEEMRHAIVDHPRVRVLAGNPMMLTILFLLHEAGANLPQRRWELYEQVAKAFLFTWEERKRVAISGALDRKLNLDDREIIWLLESLALQMQQQDWTLVRRWWLSEHCASFLRDELDFSPDKARAETDTLIWSLHERVGLLVERGPDCYGFRHLALQEYFAARAVLAKDDPIAAIQPYFYHPSWREVVRLTAAQLDRRRSPQLLRTILDDPDPAGRFLCRGLLIALGCLADGCSIHDGALLAELRQQIVDLGKTKWLGITLEAIDILSELKGTRLEDFARESVSRLLDNARTAQEPEDHFSLVWGSSDAGLVDTPAGEEQDSGTEVEDDLPIQELKVEGIVSRLLIVNRRIQNASGWAERVVDQLCNDKSPFVRGACALELGRLCVHRPKLRKTLLNIFDQDKDPTVREAAAYALARVSGIPEVEQRLLEVLDRDDDPDVRGACAFALGPAAIRGQEVRNKLMSVLRSSAPVAVRVGATRGLGRVSSRYAEAQELLLCVLGNSSEPDEVRAACIWALEDVLPSRPEAAEVVFGFLSTDIDERLRSTAAQVLARFATSGRVEWSKLPIERIEQTLVSLKEPCPHALEALRSLVDERESRGLGIPMEARITRVLADVRDRIRIAFIFGSMARGDQDSESDIDLMVIGQVSLRALSPCLKRAEQELGRQVNTVIYSEGEWAQRCEERNPFVARVLKGEKIFVIGGHDELAAMA